MAYSLAGGVSASRWAGQKHFASDLVIGSALGGYVGRQVFLSDLLQRRRHSEIWHRSAGERGARKPRPFTKLEISDPLIFLWTVGSTRRSTREDIPAPSIVIARTAFYSDAQYISGYNNDGRLMGTWIGRAAQGELIRTNYRLSPRKKVGLELRHRKIDR